jgi:hypothetical protein
MPRGQYLGRRAGIGAASLGRLYRPAVRIRRHRGHRQGVGRGRRSRRSP